MTDQDKPDPINRLMPLHWYEREIRRHEEARDAERAFVEQREGWHRTLGKDPSADTVLTISRRVIADHEAIIANLKAEKGQR